MVTKMCIQKQDGIWYVMRIRCINTGELFEYEFSKKRSLLERV